MKLRIALAAALCVLAFSSCLEDVDSSNPEGSGNFTDAYVEYPGPQDKWMGPANFVMHISTREIPASDGAAREPASESTLKAAISVTPKIFTNRKPASAAAGVGMQLARDEVSRLATAMQEGDKPFSGCLSPVRVRLVRSDGTLLEKQGCRGQAGWPRVASEVVARLLEAGK
ncbi:MAG: hypothetical protein ACXWPM_09870 [Bdellovibrionota bacterium]